MKKLLIKVIKRREVEAIEIAGTLPQVSGRARSFEVREREGVKQLRRNIDSTISLWITERRERNRIEKAEAIRKMLSGDMLSTA
jgi:hypothetical protein